MLPAMRGLLSEGTPLQPPKPRATVGAVAAVDTLRLIATVHVFLWRVGAGGGIIGAAGGAGTAMRTGGGGGGIGSGGARKDGGGSPFGGDSGGSSGGLFGVGPGFGAPKPPAASASMGIDYDDLLDGGCWGSVGRRLEPLAQPPHPEA